MGIRPVSTLLHLCAILIVHLQHNNNFFVSTYYVSTYDNTTFFPEHRAIATSPSSARVAVNVRNYSIDVRCRVVVGLPKSGTTWIMNLLYTYLLALTGADVNHKSIYYAQGHVKRADFSCQYEWGEKRRSISDFTSPAVQLAYRLLPAFSHVVRNARKQGLADRPSVDEEQIEFERFFGVRRDRARAAFEAADANRPVKAGHKYAHSVFVRPHHYDTRCSLVVLIRDPLAQALSACYYYDGICGGKAGEANLTNIADVPSSNRQSLMKPLNSTIRWNRALANTLVDAEFGPPSPEELRAMTRCPRLPYFDQRTNNSHIVTRRSAKENSDDDDDDNDSGDNAKQQQQQQQQQQQHKHKPHEDVKKLMKTPPLQLFLRSLLFVTYEQLRRDVGAALRQLLLFFEFPIDEAVLNETLRVVANRPATDIKFGQTPARVADVFSQEQMRYVDELARRNDPFYVGVLAVLNSSNALLIEHDRRLNIEPIVVEPTTPSAALAWRDCIVDVEQLYRNDKCHRIWEARLMSANVSSVNNSVKIDGNTESISVRFDNDDDYIGKFSICDKSSSSSSSSSSSWKSEIIAHAVDRVLAIHRVPVSVVRFLLFVDDNASALNRHCQRGRSVLYGALSSIVPSSSSAQQQQQQTTTTTTINFNVERMSQSALEHARLIFAVFMIRSSSSSSSSSSVTTFHNLHLLVDTAHARWTADRRHENFSLTPHDAPECNRTRNAHEFECRRQQSGDAVRFAISFLHSACIFPSDVAQRLERFAALRIRPSRSVEQYVVEQQRVALQHAPPLASLSLRLWPEFAPFTIAVWNASAFDQKVVYATRILQECIDMYGRAHVVF